MFNGNFFLCCFFYYLENILLSGFAGISFLIYLVAFFISKFKRSHYVKPLFILNTIITIASFSYLLGKDSGIHIALIFIPVMTYTVNTFKKIKMTHGCFHLSPLGYSSIYPIIFKLVVLCILNFHQI